MSGTKILQDYVNRSISSIQGSGDKAAILARLRRAAGKEVGATPDIWAFTMALPGELAGETEQPSPAENAVNIALPLYAIHQQGKLQNMHESGAGSIGKATARLKAKNPDNEKGIKRRFDALATAKNYNEIINHARGIIQLLKAGDIDLDYALFAADLFLLQSKKYSNGVLRRWGRDFYSYIQIEEGKEMNDGKNDN
jgi:CRISPR system Cascade subunit CasB